MKIIVISNYRYKNYFKLSIFSKLTDSLRLHSKKKFIFRDSLNEEIEMRNFLVLYQRKPLGVEYFGGSLCCTRYHLYKYKILKILLRF